MSNFLPQPSQTGDRNSADESKMNPADAINQLLTTIRKNTTDQESR